MSEPSAQEKPAGSNHPPEDPLGLGNGVRGIGILIVVCSILWVVASFGPKAAGWIEQSVGRLTGIETTKPLPAAVPAKKPVAEAPPTAAAAGGVPLIANPRNIDARRQLLEALGGPEKAVIQHLSFSKDESMMVAAVRFLHPSPGQPEKAEIYFEIDELDRYVSTPQSPIPEPIKIYKPE